MRHLTPQQLSASLDEELTGVSKELVERHLVACPECDAASERLSALDARLVVLMSDEPGEAFFDELLEAVELRIEVPETAPSPVAARPPARKRETRPEPPRAVPRPAPEGVAARPAHGSRQPWLALALCLAVLLVAVLVYRGAGAPAFGVRFETAGWDSLARRALALVPRPAPRVPAAPEREPEAVPVVVPAPTAAPVATSPEPAAESTATAAATRVAAGPPRAAAVEPPSPEPVAAPAPVRTATPARPKRSESTSRPPAVKAPAPTGSSAERLPARQTPSTTLPGTRRIVTTTTVTPPPPPAESGMVCGEVRDRDGNPVASAQVMMSDVGVVVLTDRAGRFCMSVPVGERTLSVLAMGFLPKHRPLSVQKRTPELTIQLESAPPFQSQP